MRDFLFSSFLDKPIWLWIMFLGVIILLLVLDLGLFHRKNQTIALKESLRLSAFYISVGLLFGVWIYWFMDAKSAQDYLTGFLVEKSLSLDNLFVISIIMSFFKIPEQYIHRVLFWGILGVIVLRGLMIAAGAALMTHLIWIPYVFAVFLVITGVKMMMVEESSLSLEDNWMYKLLRRYGRLTDTFHGQKFFVRLPLMTRPNEKGWFMTPLFAALLMVEGADLIFAVDSIPAIFTITTDTYIVYTSNIFAILGLRALYFCLSHILHKFSYLKYALGFILIFIGGKIFSPLILGVKVPSWLSLLVTVSALIVGVVISIYFSNKKEEKCTK